MNYQHQLSFYIPLMPAKYDKKQVKTIFKQLNIGKVKRIDFTSMNKKPGFMEKNDANMKSAFIHMESIYSNSFTESIFQKLYIESKAYKIYPENNNYYWLLLKANNPIPETIMNKHQIVENCRYLEDKIEQQADIIKFLEDKLAGVQNVLEEMILGLYCPTTQSEAMNIHLKELHRTDYFKQGKKLNKNINRWEHYPTTRQGDSNEIRIKYLEKMAEKTGKLLFELTGDKLDPELELEEEEEEDKISRQHDNEYDYEYDDNYSDIKLEHNNDVNTIASSSTHSSMPSLLSMDHSLYSISSNSSSPIERRRISSELCGNE